MKRTPPTKTPEWLRLQRDIRFEIIRQRGAREYRPPIETLRIPGSPDRTMDAIVWRNLTPFLQDRPVAARSIDAEMAFRCAHDVVAYRIHYRGQFGVLLRPIQRTDAKDLTEQDILYCYDEKNFSRQRSEAIREILGGHRTRALLSVEQTPMACLAPVPPLDLSREPQLLDPAETAAIRDLRVRGSQEHSLKVVTSHEAELLDELRGQNISPDRVREVLRAVLAENDSDS